MKNFLSNPIIFWIGWVIIPLVVEFIPCIFNFFFLIAKKKKNKKYYEKKIEFYPTISILIPVYNSSKTLKECIRSIYNSTYDNKYIDVLCIDNGSKDDSFKIFEEIQKECPELSINWISSKQGKSNALNKALFNTKGKYIFNIDSDGKLEKNAIYNMVRKFETNKDISCMTGTILTDPELIEETKSSFLKIFRRLEYIEYCQSFLAGRNYQSITDSIFTLSGAFSAFRKDIILKTQMYNTDTICEDTHMTFQIRENLKEKIYYCEDSIFIVDPIDDFNKFYTQRQRWQIGELEVSKMFLLKYMKNILNSIRNPSIRLLILDHTVSFSRFIWYFVLIALCISNNYFSLILKTSLLIYIMYVICSFLYFFNICSFLENFKEYLIYFKKQLYLIIFYPIYNLVSFIVRFCGIINSIERKSSWKTLTLTDEKNLIKDDLKSTFSFIYKIRNFWRKILE